MEEEKKSYFAPIIIGVIVLILLFSGGAVWYFNRPKENAAINAGVSLQTSPTASEWEVVKVEGQTITFRSGTEELSLENNMFAVEDNRKLAEGQKVELSRPVVGEPLKVRIVE